MSRIRSVHPGLFTDEAFASLGMAARVLLIGLWTECDDQGVFEWKPITLKMRLMPVDHVDIPALLAELQSVNAIRKYENGAKEYGAVRNFGRFQRPKKPHYVHSMPDELRTYVALKAASGEPEPVKEEAIPQKGETPPQMEDGGGGKEEEEKVKSSLRSEPPPKEKVSRRKAKSALSEGWVVSEAGNVYALKIGLLPREIPRQAQMFINNAKQNDRQVSDWEAAWRNWCLKALEFAGRELPDADKTVAVKGFYADSESPELTAWDEYAMRQRGKKYPRDRNGGWHFPTRWPPDHKQEAA